MRPQSDPGLLQAIRGFLGSKGGVAVAVVLALLGAWALWASLRAFVGDSEAAAAARDRLFICAQTGASFRYKVQHGTSIPVLSPYSKSETGYPAELCYWTADGQVKSEPTPVLLNSYLGKDEPTFCPDCGRLVVGHNPVPVPGSRPPPTRAQYRPRSGDRR